MTDGFLNARFERARLLMRPQTPDDAAALHEGYADAALMTWWSSGPHASVEETRAYLSDRAMPGEWRGWVMTERAGGAVVGTLPAGHHRASVKEIGYMLIRRFWGQGYAREGVARSSTCCSRRAIAA